MPRAIVLLAKLPEAGRVKTRLEAHLPRDRVLALYRACLLDTLDMLAAATEPLGARAFWSVPFTGPAALEEARRLAPSAVECFEQGAGDLGARIEHARATAAQATGPGAVVIAIGADAPLLGPPRLGEAFAAARRCVLGPAEDGGFDLILLAEASPWLGAPIRWSTEHAADDTEAAAQRAGVEVARLGPGTDLDRFEDLAPIHARIAAGEAPWARRTRAALDTILGL